MKKRVIYSGFSNERQLSVDYLKEKHDWEPVFFFGEESLREWVEKYYPDADFQESMAIRQARFDYSKIGPPVPVDAKVIEALSKYELSCLNVLEDTTGWNFSFYERRRYYYDILKYWNTVIHYLKPDLYVHMTWPHMISDYSLYLLCKHYYSIPTIFIDAIPLFENSYHIICPSLEDMSSSFKDVYHSGQNCDLQMEIKEYLNRIRSKKGKTPDHISSFYKKAKKYESFQYKEFIKLILMTLLRGKGFRKTIMAFKKDYKPFDSLDSKLNHFQYFWFKDRLRRQNKNLRKIYTQFCDQPDFKKKYIYFAASYQPEAATCPNACVYEDVFLILDIISASIPDGWMIYFKEHPGTFSANLKGSLRRNRHFYQKVASYKNIVMISAETDTFELIDHSQAVVTATGTVGWEASVRGKPSLFFGNVWYQGCKSLFRINTYQDCIDAIEKIKNGYTPDQKDIEDYAMAIQQVSVKGMVHRDFYENIKKCSDPKFEMERIAKALHEAYERHYGPKKVESSRVS